MFVALDLDAAQALLGQVFWVVHIDHVIVFHFFAFDSTLDHAILDEFTVGAGMGLQGGELALSQIFNVDLAI